MLTKFICLNLDPSNTSFHLSKMDAGPNGNQRQQGARDVEACPIIRPICTMPTFQSFRIEGRVTTSCLWHACRAVTIGTILIGTGITMAILGNITANKRNVQIGTPGYARKI